MSHPNCTKTDRTKWLMRNMKTGRCVVPDTLSVVLSPGEDRGPPLTITLTKDGAGLGFSLEGGKDSPLGDKALTIKKIFTGKDVDLCIHNRYM
jgi:hypothetical protein